MKKTSILFLLALLPIALIAQPAEGNFYVSGNLQFSVSGSKNISGNTTTDGPTFTSYRFGPTAGFFLDENFLVGASVGFSNSIAKSTGNNWEERQSRPLYFFSPFARYYLNVAGDLYVYGGGFAEIGFGKYKDEETIGGTTITDEDNRFILGFGGRMGLAYYISPVVAMELNFAGLSLDWDTRYFNDDNKRRNFNFDFVAAPSFPSIGLSILF